MSFTMFAEYQIWANDQIREIILTLSDEEFEQETIQGLCIHTMAAIDWNLETMVHRKVVDWGEMLEALMRMSKEELMNKWMSI